MLTSARPGKQNWYSNRCLWISRGAARPARPALFELLGEEDPRLEHMLGMQAIARHWGELPPREQEILVMRFYGGMTHAQIGRQLGLSQMQISRLLARALSFLRPRLFGQLEYVTEAGPDPAPSMPSAAPHPHRRQPSSAPAAAGRQRWSVMVLRLEPADESHGAGFAPGTYANVSYD
jgi:hypothetical protein